MRKTHYEGDGKTAYCGVSGANTVFSDDEEYSTCKRCNKCADAFSRKRMEEGNPYDSY